MRINYLAMTMVLVGGFFSIHENAAAQSASYPPAASAPNAMRSALTTRGMVTLSDDATPTPPTPVGVQADRVVGEIRSMEQGMEQANRLLQQRLAKSEQVRRQGLQKQDQRLLQQAENMDRQAIAAYEQTLRQFETFSQRIEQTSEFRAEQAAARANGNRSAGTTRPSPSTGDSSSGPFRGLFRFGGR